MLIDPLNVWIHPVRTEMDHHSSPYFLPCPLAFISHWGLQVSRRNASLGLFTSAVNSRHAECLVRSVVANCTIKLFIRPSTCILCFFAVVSVYVDCKHGSSLWSVWQNSSRLWFFLRHDAPSSCIPRIPPEQMFTCCHGAFDWLLLGAWHMKNDSPVETSKCFQRHFSRWHDYLTLRWQVLSEVLSAKLWESNFFLFNVFVKLVDDVHIMGINVSTFCFFYQNTSKNQA